MWEKSKFVWLQTIVRLSEQLLTSVTFLINKINFESGFDSSEISRKAEIVLKGNGCLAP